MSAQELPRVLSYQGKVASGGVPFEGVGQFKFALLAPSGSGASAVASLSAGSVASLSLVSGGSGYLAAPAVRISGGGGSGATATATISGGVVTGITVTAPGSGYSSAPTVSFEAAEGDYTVIWRNDGGTGAGEPATAVALNVTRGLFSARIGDVSFPNMAEIGPEVLSKYPVNLRIWFNNGSTGSQVLSPDVRVGASFFANKTSVASGAGLGAYSAIAASTFGTVLQAGGDGFVMVSVGGTTRGQKASVEIGETAASLNIVFRGESGYYGSATTITVPVRKGMYYRISGAVEFAQWVPLGVSP